MDPAQAAKMMANMTPEARASMNQMMANMDPNGQYKQTRQQLVNSGARSCSRLLLGAAWLPCWRQHALHPHAYTPCACVCLRELGGRTRAFFLSLFFLFPFLFSFSFSLSSSSPSLCAGFFFWLLRAICFLRNIKVMANMARSMGGPAISADQVKQVSVLFQNVRESASLGGDAGVDAAHCVAYSARPQHLHQSAHLAAFLPSLLFSFSSPPPHLTELPLAPPPFTSSYSDAIEDELWRSGHERFD